MDISVRNGAINSCSLDSSSSEGKPDKGLLGLRLHEIRSWTAAIDGEKTFRQLRPQQKARLASWLEEKLPRLH